LGQQCYDGIDPIDTDLDKLSEVSDLEVDIMLIDQNVVLFVRDLQEKNKFFSQCPVILCR